MQKSTLARLLGIVLILGACVTTWAQSTYSNAVVALNPAGYWPLNETAQPPQVLNLTATNSGTLGAQGNGSYGAWYQPWGNQWYLTNDIVTEPGPISSGDTALNCTYNPGQYIVLPRDTNGVPNAALTIQPPFSIEAWVNPGTTIARLDGIVSEGEVQLLAGGSNPTNPFYDSSSLITSWAGFAFGQYQNYFFFSTFCTNGYNIKSSELDLPHPTGGGLQIGQWIYVVCTFTAGGVETMYTNGVQAATKTVPANARGQHYVPDPTSPLMVGSGSDVPIDYGNSFQGGLAEVAIYNEILPQSSMTAHYQTAGGTNATFGANYASSVAADSPILYYRMNDGQTQTNAGYASASFPVAKNYGSLGVSGSGVYQPGTTPGVAGPAFTGFGANSKGVAINGWLGAVDIGSSNLPAELNPTGAVPMTVVSWFQTGPADSPGRFQEILGHSDQSYRLSLGQFPNIATHFNPGPGPELQFSSAAQAATNGYDFNDGLWHMAAGVTDGTNEYLYLDGSLALSNNTPTGINIVSTNTDLLLGGDPEYTISSTGNASALRNFDGNIAQVAFFTNALTAAQIQVLFNAADMTPYIWQQPVSSLTANQGQTVTISTGIRGGNVTYQWYTTNGVAVTGQTGSSLNFTPAVAANSGAYYVVASNASGSITSSVVNVTVFGPPVITAQSLTQLEIFTGSSPTLFVTASGVSPAYQWNSNNVAIFGATNSTYTITNITASGTYGCTITNILGTNYITPISITVLADPTAPYPAQVLANRPMSYYRLDEPNGVTTAYDYVGGFNADYTNTSGFQGEPGYSSQNSISSDPSETSVYFGAASSANSLAIDAAPYPNFGTPNGQNAEFSVEAWVQQVGYNGSGDCIVGVGYGGGGEQFVLDTGATSAGDVRFFVRNAAGTTAAASSTALINGDGLWHHIVGVCDEAGGHLYLYMDGKLLASGTITAGSGLLASTMPLTIGARESANNIPVNYDYQFDGLIDDVSVYNKALSAAQVQADYNASGIIPVNVQVQPGNISTNQGANVTFIATAQGGTPPLSYQWNYNNNPISGQTATNLVLTDVQTSQSGNYSVTVANTYGSTNVSVSLTVNMGAAQISQDIQPTNVLAYQGDPVTLTFVATGSFPIYYQWFEDGARVAGATNSAYSFGALLGTNTYYCVASNNFSYSEGSGPVTSSTATVVGIGISTVNPANFNSRLKISFIGYTNAETLQYFPALVRLGTNLTGFSYSEFAGGNGSDLRFADSSGTRELPYEVDQWNGSNNVSTFWVQIPALSGGTNNYIWAYWGNPADTAQPTYTTNGTVWEPASFLGLPGYDVVYHLQQTNFPYLDSTLQYPALGGGSVPPGSAPAIVGNGAVFSGNNSQYLDAGDVNLSNQFTMSAWVDLAPSELNIQGLWVNGPGGYDSAEVALFINDYGNSADGAVLVGTGDGTAGAQPETATGLVLPGQWHLVTAAVNRTAGSIQFYVDGTPEALSGSGSGGVTTDFPTNTDMFLGRFTTPNFPLNGVLDEARIHGGIDDSNWVWADYQTVANNSTFSSYSSVTNNITLPITLTIRVSGDQAILTWPAGTLQSSGNLNGPYSNVAGATSPYTNAISGAQQFYRVQAQF